MLLNPHRQVIRRCANIRHLSSSAPCRDNGVILDAAATKIAAQVPPPTRRPRTDDFGGISIRNIAVQPAVQDNRNRPQFSPQNRRPFNNARQGAERNSNSDVRSAQRSPRTGDINNRPRRRAPAQLGWGDDLVSEQSLASRLWSRQQIDGPAADASTSKSRSTTSGLPTTPKQSPSSPSTRETPRKAKMVRTPNEVEAVQSKETSKETVVVPKSKASASKSVTSEAPNTKPSQSDKAEHPVQMVDLASTNLTTLFATPVPKVQTLAPSLKGLQLRDAYERRSGDYTRFASGQVIRKTARKALEPVRYARHVLGFSRHLSLKQRVKAVKVIESVVS